jgi:hypothetical protein
MRIIQPAGGTRAFPWRLIGWGLAAALLCVPLIAMQVTREVKWQPGDFLVAAALLGAAGGLVELAILTTRRRAARMAAVAAIAAGLLLVWAELAVGLLD